MLRGHSYCWAERGWWSESTLMLFIGISQLKSRWPPTWRLRGRGPSQIGHSKLLQYAWGMGTECLFRETSLKMHMIEIPWVEYSWLQSLMEKGLWVWGIDVTNLCINIGDTIHDYCTLSLSRTLTLRLMNSRMEQLSDHSWAIPFKLFFGTIWLVDSALVWTVDSLYIEKWCKGSLYLCYPTGGPLWHL